MKSSSFDSTLWIVGVRYWERRIFVTISIVVVKKKQKGLFPLSILLVLFFLVSYEKVKVCFSVLEKRTVKKR